jgi:hypothetical protein
MKEYGNYLFANSKEKKKWDDLIPAPRHTQLKAKTERKETGIIEAFCGQIKQVYILLKRIRKYNKIISRRAS